jgi:hypothetical protein
MVEEQELGVDPSGGNGPMVTEDEEKDLVPTGVVVGVAKRSSFRRYRVEWVEFLLQKFFFVLIE